MELYGGGRWPTATTTPRHGRTPKMEIASKMERAGEYPARNDRDEFPIHQKIALEPWKP